MKKKIIIGITKGTWGGAQRYVYDWTVSLPKEEFEIKVVFGQKGRLVHELQKVGIQTSELPALGRNVSFGADLKSFFELFSLFRKEKPDIVHLNSSKMGGLGSVAARFAGVHKIIFTAHGWPFWEKRNPLSRMAIWFFSWLTALFSHTIIVISNYDLRVACRMPLVNKKTICIYNGIYPIEFLPRESQKNSVRVLTNGELVDNKNLFIGIDAVAKARAIGVPIIYSIIGDGELRKSLGEYINRKKYNEFISLLGFIPEGSRFYKNYDIFFLPSKKEGLPYVLLEAGLAELPVITSNVGGIPEIVEHEKSGLLYSPYDVDGFAKALQKLATSTSERFRLGKKLKEKVENDFSFTQMFKKTIALYRS